VYGRNIYHLQRKLCHPLLTPIRSKISSFYYSCIFLFFYSWFFLQIRGCKLHNGTRYFDGSDFRELVHVFFCYLLVFNGKYACLSGVLLLIIKHIHTYNYFKSINRLVWNYYGVYFILSFFYLHSFRFGARI